MVLTGTFPCQQAHLWATFLSTAPDGSDGAPWIPANPSRHAVHGRRLTTRGQALNGGATRWGRRGSLGSRALHRGLEGKGPRSTRGQSRPRVVGHGVVGLSPPPPPSLAYWRLGVCFPHQTTAALRSSLAHSRIPRRIWGSGGSVPQGCPWSGLPIPQSTCPGAAGGAGPRGGGSGRDPPLPGPAPSPGLQVFARRKRLLIRACALVRSPHPPRRT